MTLKSKRLDKLTQQERLIREKDVQIERNEITIIHRNGIISKLMRDIGHALSEAKQYCPDYPWDSSPKTASIAVWALGQGYEGVSRACDDLHKQIDEIRMKKTQ